MVKTPRTRSGSRKPPVTIDLAADPIMRDRAAGEASGRAPDTPSPADQPPADSPEARFAAQESLTPGEAASAEVAMPPSEPPIALLSGDVPQADAPSAAAARADASLGETGVDDTFRFPAEAAVPPAEADARESEEQPPAASLSEEIGPQPGDASTPLFADPAPQAADAGEAPPVAAAAIVPAERRSGTGRFAAAGFMGGALALLLAGLLQYAGVLPNVGPDQRVDTAVLETRLAGLNQAFTELRDAQGRLDGSVSGSLATLRNDVAALQGAGSGATDLERQIDEVARQVEAASASAAPLDRFTALLEEVAALGERVSAAQGEAERRDAALAEASQQAQALEGRVAALEPKVAAVSEQPRIALALAASGLKEAAERGVPFEAELATLGAIRPDLGEIAELQPLAASGVATLDAVQTEWGAAADAMVAAANPADAEAGVVGRLWSSATGLVSVRPVGAVEGTSAEAIVARMDEAVKAGDLARALGEYEALPEPAKAAGAPWAERARALDTANRLIDRAVASANKPS